MSIAWFDLGLSCSLRNYFGWRPIISWSMPHKVDSATLKKPEVHSPHANSEHINGQTMSRFISIISPCDDLSWSLPSCPHKRSDLFVLWKVYVQMIKFAADTGHLVLTPIWKLDIPALILRAKAQLSIPACFNPACQPPVDDPYRDA